jgi:hypothetical protein
MAFVPKYSSARSDMIAVLLNEEALEKMNSTTEYWMRGWVEEATISTDKSHTFNCKGDKIMRDWKLTIHETNETLPDGAQKVTVKDREVTASFIKRGRAIKVI